MSPKIERSPAPPAPSRAAPAPEATPVSAPQPPAAASPETAATFSPPAALDSSSPWQPGAHVATSADPGSLWGPPARRGPDLQAFARLPPAERQARVAELETQRAQLGDRIHARVDTLDHRWRYMRVADRSSALRTYQRRSRVLDPGTRSRVDAQLARAEAAQRRIDAIQARSARLAQSGGATDLRKQLATELSAARAEQSAAVKEATRVIDDKGLKVDRLAQTEQLIDPNAPPEGSGSSLLDMVTSWFSLSWLLDSVATIQQSRTQEQENKEERQRHEERIEDDRNRADMLRRRLNEELAARRTRAS